MSYVATLAERGWAIDYAIQINDKPVPVQKILEDAGLILRFLQNEKSANIKILENNSNEI